MPSMMQSKEYAELWQIPPEGVSSFEICGWKDLIWWRVLICYLCTGFYNILKIYVCVYFLWSSMSPIIHLTLAFGWGHREAEWALESDWMGSNPILPVMIFGTLSMFFSHSVPQFLPVQKRDHDSIHFSGWEKRKWNNALNVTWNGLHRGG